MIAEPSGFPARFFESPLIPRSEESDLSWYFGPGAAHFERSTFGEQLHRARNLDHESKPCAKCEGYGYLDPTPERMIERGRRIETLIERAKDEHDATKRKEADERVAVEREALTKETVCPLCNGTKVTARKLKKRHPQLTVKPKFAAREETGVEPDDWALCRYARVSRRLGQLTEATQNVLRLFYGDVGSRWASAREGRLLALYALTPPGKTLARRGLSKDAADALEGLGVRPDESVASQAEAERAKSDPKRGSLLAKARDQATAMLRDAAHAWGMTR